MERKDRAKPEKKQQSPPPPGRIWNIIFLLLLGWLTIVLISNFLINSDQHSISYTEFKRKIDQRAIKDILIKGKNVSGTMTVFDRQEDVAEEKKKKVEQQPFTTTLPPYEDPALPQLFEKHSVIVNVRPDERPWLLEMLIAFLPWVIIIAFFLYFSKKMSERMGGVQGGLFKFAKSKARLYHKSESEVRMDDVAGLGGAKQELQEIIDYLKDPGRFLKMGGKLPKGILLVGPPGTGKTLLARAVAGEAQVPFFSISGSEFIEMFVGVGASRVRDMFDNAKKEQPAIIFIDELDAIGRARGTGVGGGHDEREQTLNQILSEMDGFSSRESVIVLAATNRPDVLDQALIRPGRFDRQITLERPQQKARLAILKIHTRKMPLADDIDLESVARRTVGFSGADLENLANEAALLAARNNREKVLAEDFDQSMDKIILGVLREDLVNDEEKKIVAFHESGHALLAWLLPGADPLKKVSIIPRGRALGATQQMPVEDRFNLGKAFLLNRICIMLGGRAAEKINFDDITSGAGNDLKEATQLARKMVCQLGMSEKIGPVTFQHGEEHPFLGREMTQPKDFSEYTARVIDEEVRRIISEMEEKALAILGENKNDLTRIAEALLEHETLTSREIEELLEKKPA
jgi:cell division protease FtsH